MNIMSNKTKQTIMLILVIVLSISVLFTVSKLNRSVRTNTVSDYAYSIGVLDATGDYNEDTSSIYTRNFITVDGLTIELVNNANVTYQVFFYDDNEDFVSATEVLSVDFAGTIPATAEFCKIVITPTNDAEVSLLEITNYASQLIVSYNK